MDTSKNVNARPSRNQQTAVVLVEPSESLNIGSVSRSMMNFGFSDLRLVAPANFIPERAEVTACGATEPLKKVSVLDNFNVAVGDCQNVVGFSARNGKNRGKVIALSEWLSQLSLKENLKTALVFGPEDNGLREEHVELCSVLIHIPTSQVYPSMNLAHAVTLALYGLSSLEHTVMEMVDRAEWRDFDQLDLLVRQVAEMSGFFHKGTPQPVPGVIKTIFRRQELSRREMAILLGLFGSAHKSLAGKIPNFRRKC